MTQPPDKNESHDLADELTSPGTVPDPTLEEERAREAAEREAESRDSTESRYEQELHEQEDHLHEAAQRLRNLPAPR